MTNLSPASITTAHYAVIGNPIAHSRSPWIHTLFAQQTGIELVYDKLYSPLDAFEKTVFDFAAQGGRGLNITVPFKLEAYSLATQLTSRAQAAKAVNTLKLDGLSILGDNTDGIGLVTDIQNNLNYPLKNKKIVLLGAGGAARGALLPLLECAPNALFIANRTEAKAQQLINEFAEYAPNTHFQAGAYQAIPQDYDILINASASSLADQLPPIPPHIWQFTLVYDMMYGIHPSPLLALANDQGIRTADGLGMLVEQAAHSFFLWHGILPSTAVARQQLRYLLDSEK